MGTPVFEITPNFDHSKPGPKCPMCGGGTIIFGVDLNGEPLGDMPAACVDEKCDHIFTIDFEEVN